MDDLDRIFAMSDEEVLAEARAAGEDPHKLAATGRMMLETVLWGRSPSLFCRIGKCRSVRPYDDVDGVGGKCDNCGRVHGWVTREELRRYADALDAATRTTTP